ARATGRGDDGGRAEENLGDREPLRERRVTVDDVVVEIMGDRVGDGQQQTVGGGERRRQTARHDEARDHEGKPRAGVATPAASAPAMTRPVITKGSPATSGMDSTTKSVLRMTKSAHCTMPSPFLSTTVKSPAGCQNVTQPGSSLIFEPTNRVNTAKRAKAA